MKIPYAVWLGQPGTATHEPGVRAGCPDSLKTARVSRNPRCPAGCPARMSSSCVSDKTSLNISN